MANETWTVDQIHPDPAIELVRKILLESTGRVNAGLQNLQALQQQAEQQKQIVQMEAAKRREAIAVLLAKVPGFQDPDIPKEPQAGQDQQPAEARPAVEGPFKLAK